MNTLTKEHAISFMQSSATIVEWNDRREAMKALYGVEFVTRHIDASGLIGKTKIASKPCE